MEPLALPYVSGLLSDVALGMFAALCAFAVLCACLRWAWTATMRWRRRRAILARLAEPVPEPAGEVWIGCGCRSCTVNAERLADTVLAQMQRRAMAAPGGAAPWA